MARQNLDFSSTPFEIAGPDADDRIFTNAMVKMYGWVTLGMVTTDAAAAIAHSIDLVATIGFIGFIVCIAASFVLLLVLMFTAHRVPPTVAATMYLGFTAVEGITLSVVLSTFSGATIFQPFGITAGVFGVMTVIGVTTKRDLTRWGPILGFALLGAVIALAVNWFIGSSLLEWIITLALLPIFLGLVVWETKSAKDMAREAASRHDDRAAGRIAILSAVGLYLIFLNIFLIVLRILDFFGGDD